jgi:ubiquinone/menaquinone biosynthesis C-methylase UbiE
MQVLFVIEWIVMLISITIVCIVIMVGVAKSKKPREVGFAEGIDDAAVAEAFNAIQKLPQFKMIRNIIISHVISPKIGGSIAQGASLLDLGCGTGHLLIDFNNAITSGKLPSLKLHGIDIGTESVRVCQERLSLANITDVELREGDGAEMPYQDESMDIVVTSLSLHHWSEPVRVLNEIHRILRLGGLLILFDMRRDCKKFWHWLLGFATRVIVPKALRNVREPLGSLLSSYTTDELRNILSKTRWSEAEYRVEGVLFAQLLESRK